jgi:threonine synthase
VVRAFEQGESKTTYWEDAHTVAAGLRVPKPLGDVLTLAAIRESGGTAIAVTDEELLDASLEIAETTGIFAAPEGGACLAGLKKLLSNGFLRPDERIVLYNTATGLKYLEAFSTRFPQSSLSEHDKLGGLITPR